MPSIDMPLDQLRQYKPCLYREEDFEKFWEQTVAEAAAQPLNAELIPFKLPMRGLECFAVRYDGYQNGRIAGWYVRPDGKGPFPGLVRYHGYSGVGERPLDLIREAAQGICVLSMDCRGQGGHSTDGNVYEAGHSHGWMTLGIASPKTYYYRYVYADAVRALELLARREEVDASRLAITGGSQGGALTLAVAALSERPILAMPDIAFLCDFRRSIQITPDGPYPEIVKYLKQYPSRYEQTLRTLSYFDCLNLAPWIKCRTLHSVGLCDNVCPPSTVFSAYNHITAPKQMDVYPFHLHEIPYDHVESRWRLMIEMLRP